MRVLDVIHSCGKAPSATLGGIYIDSIQWARLGRSVRKGIGVGLVFLGRSDVQSEMRHEWVTGVQARCCTAVSVASR